MGHVISSSILFPCVILGVQLIHPMVARYEDPSGYSIVYRSFITAVIVGMAMISVGLTNDLAIDADQPRFAACVGGWFVIMLLIVHITTKYPLDGNISGLKAFEL